MDELAAYNLHPLISIIIPVNDCINYLSECIRSICCQTYNNIEIIIVNTSGTNDIINIINEINDDRIKIIHLSSNNGLTFAFSEGYKAAKGEFISRHDPDDISTPHRFEKQLNYLLEHPKLGMVSCLINCITTESIYRSPCLFIEKLQNQYRSEESINNAIMNDFIPIIFSTLLIRRETLMEVNITDEVIDFDDQIDLLCNLLKVGGVEKLNEVLYSYRRHKDAYHLKNDKEFTHHSISAIKRTDLKNYIKYKEFYDQIKQQKKNNIKIDKENNLRVLMLIDALNIGGTETHVFNLSRKLIEMGAHVVIGTNGGPFANLFELYGIKVVNVPLNRDYISNKDIFSLLENVKSIINKEKINLIHSHLFGSMRLGSEISKRLNIPHITTIHGLFYPKDILLKTLYNVSNVIAVSEPVKESLHFNLGMDINTQINVIPNAVYIKNDTPNINKKNIREELGISEDDILITYCSRLAWKKTAPAENLIFSIYKLDQLDYHNVHAVIIGDGDGKEIVKKEANMINSIVGKEIIHVVGTKLNVEDYYENSDIVIGTGRVAIEAMSCGKPVIAVGNQGYVGIISPATKEVQWNLYFGDHGFLSKIDVHTLTDDLRTLIDDKDQRHELGKWVKEWCQEMFNIDNVVKDTMTLYEDCINNFDDFY